jgi:hypothetical protein
MRKAVCARGDVDYEARLTVPARPQPASHTHALSVRVPGRYAADLPNELRLRSLSGIRKAGGAERGVQGGRVCEGGAEKLCNGDMYVEYSDNTYRSSIDV